ncbi:MAG TPA: preprotein translocase subunit YajC [Gaiellaceae bacterium]|nr:preprotein translocase subunit YajC [Gaiellaceae bacterium]
MSFLIIMVLLLVVMYVLMIRPQRQRQQQQQAMVEGASVGDDVLTTGGIYGTVTKAEGDDIVVEIAEGLEVHMTRRGIAAVLPPETEDEPDVVDAEPMEANASDEAGTSDEADEAAVTDGEEPVTSEAAADATSGDRR